MPRYSFGDEYEVSIPTCIALEVAKVLKANNAQDSHDVLKSSVGLGNKTLIDVNTREWSKPAIDAVLAVLRTVSGVPGTRTAISFLRAINRIRENPAKPIRKLELLPEAIARFLAKDAIDGWLYSNVDGHNHVAYVVEEIHYDAGERDREPYVLMDLFYSHAEINDADEPEQRGGSRKVRSVVFRHHDIWRKTVEQCLLQEGFLKETEELKQEYLKTNEKFLKLRAKHNEQFTCTGTAIEANREYWWRSDSYKFVKPTKTINNEGLLERKADTRCSNGFWERYGIKGNSDTFSRVPLHPYILMFDLEKHVNVWVHTESCKVYKYQPELKEKLVLPKQHRDLIEVLTEDMDVFTEDIVEGKSGGTAILCYGAPGLGKTLTAEVYSEVVKRPLYRVHSGQLGTSSENVENNLKTILKRAERWGAVLLIDEADVYIRRRSDDVEHNAIVAAFLRNLEYFNGLLFLTTNRASDVDDAIASRMVATFKYNLPNAEQSIALWKILSEQANFPLNDTLIRQIYQAMPETSGRDIKQLVKLTMKYCKRRNVKPTLDTFRVCAMFRGIV